MKQIPTSLATLNNLKAQSTGCWDGLSTSSSEAEDLCFKSLTFWIVTKKRGLESYSGRASSYLGRAEERMLALYSLLLRRQ